MTSERSWGLKKVARAISTIAQKQATGELRLTAGQEQWLLYFRQGRLLLATAPVHRVRRWHRALRHGKVQFVPSVAPQVTHPLWECRWLLQGVCQQAVTLEQAKETLAYIFWEVAFLATADPEVVCHWSSRAIEFDALTLPAELVHSLGLTWPELEVKLRDLHRLQLRWAALEMDLTWGDRAPVLREVEWSMSAQTQTDSTTYLSLRPLLNGQRTTWDVMMTMRQPPAIVAHILHHMVQQSLLEFRTIGDMPIEQLLPADRRTVGSEGDEEGLARSRPEGTPPLVVCIDDSPQVCREMERIIRGMGYRFIAIQDSVRALPTLIEHKPDLIFLDLIMPIANGYEVCKQIRRVKALEATPVAILTGNDGAIDRVRAKVVGASDFLAKPVRSDRIRALLRKYFASTKPYPRPNSTVLGEPSADRLPGVADRPDTTDSLAIA